jgi:hypothetical protein
MRSHGHGQGYLDLNFVIPELIERIAYTKGPLRADRGDFSLAGSAAFFTVNRLDRPYLEVTAGEFGYYRAVAAGSSATGTGDLLVGLEGTLYNRPWVLDEDLEKLNALLKSSTPEWGLSASLYRADWTSSDQVPLRAVRSGRTSRFGFIDPDLGGRTTRIGISADGQIGAAEVALYAVRYRFRLTSNFTYLLDDPVSGDEFQQRDRRQVYGGSVRHGFETQVGALSTRIRLGADLRYDDVGLVGLYRSAGGLRRESIREDRIDEASAGLWGEADVAIAPGLRAILGARAESTGLASEPTSL